MLELKMRNYGTRFEVDFGKLIKRYNGGSKKKCTELSAVFEETKVTVKGKEYVEKSYHIDAINEKHLVGAIMRTLGEKLPYEFYKDSETCKIVERALRVAKIKITRMPFVSVTTGNYGVIRDKSPSAIPTYNRIMPQYKAIYEEINRVKPLNWKDFLAGFQKGVELVDVSEEMIECIPEGVALKDFFKKDPKVNPLLAEVWNSLDFSSIDFCSKKYVQCECLCECIDSKENVLHTQKEKGGKLTVSKGLISGISRPVYRVHFDVSVFIDLPDNLLDVLDGDGSFCACDSFIEFVETDIVPETDGLLSDAVLKIGKRKTPNTVEIIFDSE